MKNKSLVTIILVSIVTFAALVFSLYKFVLKEKTVFYSDGYVSITDSDVPEKAYFIKGTEYKKGYSDDVIFTSKDDKKTVASIYSFAFYNDKSISFLNDGVLMPLDDLNEKYLLPIGYELNNMFLVDWNEDVSEIAKTLNNDALGIRCDVSSDTDVQKSVNDIIEKFGHIDFLVANAGIGGGLNKAHEVSVDEWNKVIGVNQTGIFLMNKYVISEMLKNGGGAIVNTSSMYGLVGTTMSFAYSASKGAINQMTRSLALTYARDNIRVNAVAPGYVDTPILAEVPKDMKDAMANQLPVGRLGKDTEIANLICYLLSDDATFITGAIVPIDGGFTAA